AVAVRGDRRARAVAPTRPRLLKLTLRVEILRLFVATPTFVSRKRNKPDSENAQFRRPERPCATVELEPLRFRIRAPAIESREPRGGFVHGRRRSSWRS